MMKYLLSFMLFNTCGVLVRAAECKLPPVHPVRIQNTAITSSNSSYSWRGWAMLACASLIGLGARHAYYKYIASSDNSGDASVDLSTNVSNTDAQQQLQQALEQLIQAKEAANSSDIAIKRSEQQAKEKELQHLALDAIAFIGEEHQRDEALSLDKVRFVEEKLKEKINIIYTKHHERMPTYETDEEARKKHSPPNRRKSLTRAGNDARDYWSHLHNLQRMRVIYTDITKSIEEVDGSVKNLEDRVKNLKSSLGIYTIGGVNE